MGQSRFKWIIVFGDGTIRYFAGTWDELISWGAGLDPVAVIRGEFV